MDVQWLLRHNEPEISYREALGSGGYGEVHKVPPPHIISITDTIEQMYNNKTGKVRTTDYPLLDMLTKVFRAESGSSIRKYNDEGHLKRKARYR